MKLPFRTFMAMWIVFAIPASASQSAPVTDCLECHGKRITDAHAEGAEKVSPFVDNAALSSSVHSDLECVDCHGRQMAEVPHTELALLTDVSGFCGACHSDVLDEYTGSVHGAARRRGVADAPGCAGCHGGHSILSSENPASTVYASNVPIVCSRCHAEERITGKYGLATKRLETYESSFHGVAIRYGEAVVANCASCHGIHNILPSSNPASSIAPENLPATCGKCHVGAENRFAIGKVHVEATKESSRGMFYVRRFYTWLIGILSALFVLHITMDIVSRRRRSRLETERARDRESR